MSVVFIDPHSAKGGGQVVLEELLRIVTEAGRVGDVHLVMPADGRSQIAVPSGVVVHDQVGAFESTADGPVVLVSNANASHVRGLRLARRLAGSGPVATVAILHNYPRGRLRSKVLAAVLRRYSTVVVVEPGLLALAPDAFVPSWLSVRRSDMENLVPDDHQSVSVDERPRVRVYARPDRMKGLHLLPAVFRALGEAGVDCQVALGSTIDDDVGYEARLRRELAPWLQEGRRGPGWLEPGDIFIAPSIFGEAACLAVQEVMIRGAVVVASRVGLMSYLTPESASLRTFRPGDVDACVAEVLQFARLQRSERVALGIAGREALARRAGRWYEEVSELVATIHGDA